MRGHNSFQQFQQQMQRQYQQQRLQQGWAYMQQKRRQQLEAQRQRQRVEQLRSQRSGRWQPVEHLYAEPIMRPVPAKRGGALRFVGRAIGFLIKLAVVLAILAIISSSLPG